MHFRDFYAGHRAQTISLEFFPPRKTEALGDTLSLIRDLAEFRPDYITCTYGAGGGTRNLTRQIVSFVHQELKIPSVAHLTCAGHSVAEIDQILEQLAQEGIKHILALRGDPPKGSDRFEPHPEGFADARELTEHIARTDRFSIAVAGYPEGHRESRSVESDFNYLRAKLDAGAEIVFTQLFFDADIYFRFRDEAAKRGINAPIVPGIMPLSAVSQIERFREQFSVSIPQRLEQQILSVSDTPSEVSRIGAEAVSELARRLLDGGAPGIHLYTLNRPAQIRVVLENLMHQAARRGG